MADPTPVPVPVPVPGPGSGAGQQQPPQQQQTGGQRLIVPEEVQKKHPQLIDLIKASESMNDEERQYWVNILPIMTPEQIKNLFEILENERKQLSAIDAKYQNEIQRIGEAEVSRQTEDERRKRREQRTSTEQSAKQQEDQAADDLLKQIGGL